MEIKNLKKDAKAIADGQWVSDIPQMGDLRLLVRGTTSLHVVTLRSRLERKVEKKDRERDGSIKVAVGMEVTRQVFLDAVLIDWDGLTNDGQPVPYSKEQAKEWLFNDDYRDFADAVAWAANIVDQGNKEQTDALAGNSPKQSAGK